VQANRIARWNGSSWAPVGSGITDPAWADAGVWSLAVLSNGDLVAGGTFTSAGGVVATNIARWDGAAWASLGSGTDSSVLTLTVLSNG
jgi:hypothetical protein